MKGNRWKKEKKRWGVFRGKEKNGRTDFGGEREQFIWEKIIKRGKKSRKRGEGKKLQEKRGQEGRENERREPGNTNTWHKPPLIYSHWKNPTFRTNTTYTHWKTVAQHSQRTQVKKEKKDQKKRRAKSSERRTERKKGRLGFVSWRQELLFLNLIWLLLFVLGGFCLKMVKCLLICLSIIVGSTVLGICL